MLCKSHRWILWLIGPACEQAPMVPYRLESRNPAGAALCSPPCPQTTFRPGRSLVDARLGYVFLFSAVYALDLSFLPMKWCVDESFSGLLWVQDCRSFFLLGERFEICVRVLWLGSESSLCSSRVMSLGRLLSACGVHVDVAIP